MAIDFGLLTSPLAAPCNRPNLFLMIQIAEIVPDEEIISSPRRQLTGTHFRRLLVIDGPL